VTDGHRTFEHQYDCHPSRGYHPIRIGVEQYLRVAAQYQVSPIERDCEFLIIRSKYHSVDIKLRRRFWGMRGQRKWLEQISLCARTDCEAFRPFVCNARDLRVDALSFYRAWGLREGVVPNHYLHTHTNTHAWKIFKKMSNIIAAHLTLTLTLTQLHIHTHTQYYTETAHNTHL
jgi:hypothetical protein